MFEFSRELFDKLAFAAAKEEIDAERQADEAEVLTEQGPPDDEDTRAISALLETMLAQEGAIENIASQIHELDPSFSLEDIRSQLQTEPMSLIWQLEQKHGINFDPLWNILVEKYVPQDKFDEVYPDL